MSLLSRLARTTLGVRLLAISQRLKPPGFAGATLYDALSVFVDEVRDARMTQRAASVAFFLLLALFPAILFLFTLIPIIPVPGLKTALLHEMQFVLPADAFGFLEAAIEEIISIRRLDLLSIGFVLAFVASTNGVNAIMRSFDKSAPTFRKRTFWQKRLRSTMLTAMLFGVLLISIGFIVGGRSLVTWMAHELGLEGRNAFVLIGALRWIIIVALVFFAISIIYKFGPAREKPWRFISAGGTVAAMLSILASLGFAAFVNSFDVYNKVFGTIGALLAIMLWMYINCLVLLIGFEINASIDRHKAMMTAPSHEPEAEFSE
jgi:membrane protein